MGYVIVLLLAAIAGGLVYWASMRFAGDADPSGGGATSPSEWGAAETERAPADAREADGDPEPPNAGLPGTAYIPVVSSRGSWQGRLSGVMGLVIAVVVAAATIALFLYEAGHIVSKMLSGATSTG